MYPGLRETSPVLLRKQELGGAERRAAVLFGPGFLLPQEHFG